MSSPIRAVLWDFGGVISTSPFDEFLRYEQDHGLPPGFLRGLNTVNPDDNAWARLERGHVSAEEFCTLYEAEAVLAGHTIRALEVLAMLSGSLRPEMVEAVRRCGDHLETALLTNNFVPLADLGPASPATPPAASAPRSAAADVLELFDVVIESSKVGVRKPDPRFYQLACEALDIEPTEAVFLDDLGINLKPARQMGMRTIKVIDPAVALAELEAIVGFELG
jgi:putative hydrolase of the HAD superfamily